MRDNGGGPRAQVLGPQFLLGLSEQLRGAQLARARGQHWQEATVMPTSPRAENYLRMSHALQPS